MARLKFDLVIESVRYTPDGKIETVRVYERRGPAFSDIFLMPRTTLMERLQQGRKCVVGQRKEFLAGSFNAGKAVQMTGNFVSTDPNKGRDWLEEVPVF